MIKDRATPLLSVIIPAYNSAGFICQSVESVLAQTFQDFEVIVIDDGSTDDTQELLQAYADKIRYIRQENAGPSSARNRGICEALGQFIAFQDSDDLWLPEKLQYQMEYLDRHPEMSVSFTDVTHFNDQGVTSRSIRSLYRRIPSGHIFAELLTHHFIALSSVVIRKSCLEKVGGFEETLIGAEDYNLFLRLANQFQFGFLNRVLVRKRLHENNLSDDLEQMCQDEISNLDKISQMFPDARIPKRRLKGQVYTRFGRYYFAQRRFARARECFARAFAHYPWGVAAWPFLALVFLPHSWRQSLLTLNKLRNRPT